MLANAPKEGRTPNEALAHRGASAIHAHSEQLILHAGATEPLPMPLCFCCGTMVPFSECQFPLHCVCYFVLSDVLEKRYVTHSLTADQAGHLVHRQNCVIVLRLYVNGKSHERQKKCRRSLLSQVGILRVYTLRIFHNKVRFQASKRTSLLEEDNCREVTKGWGFQDGCHH